MIDCEDVKFEHPSNWLIGAQSHGGKTYFVYQLLKIADILNLIYPKLFIVMQNGRLYMKK